MENHLNVASILANVLDNQFKVGGLRFGLNSFIDLIPGIGDILAALLSMYLVWIAVEMELPRLKIAHMIWNILINFLIGLIPVIGDAAYIFRKANMKNLRILQNYVRKEMKEGRVIQPRHYASA